jgi:signal transduction histidine kinase
LRRNEATFAPDSIEFLSSAERLCTQMTSTIDALLWFSQLRSNDEVAVEPLDMGKIVESSLQRLTAAVTQNQAEVVLPESWPAAAGNAGWVEEVWTNYISNAIKYGGSPPRVELGASLEEPRRFWVRDNGAGLTDEQRSRLFTEFTRLDPKRVEGHGLGLSIVQRIVEKLGGAVGCDSTPGQGSTFWFTLG